MWIYGKLPDGWSTKRIGEYATVITDYVANGSFASLAKNVNYKSKPDYAVLIRLTDFNNDYSGDFVYIDEHAYEFLGKSKLYGDEIIISNVGANVGTVFKCPKLNTKMSLAPNAIMLKTRGNDDFYYYWFRSTNGQHSLQSIVTGSAQPKFNKTNFRDLEVPVPPVDVQNKIANYLLAIDNKIQLNKQINDNLLQQIRLLISEYLPYSADDVVDNWHKISLSNIADFIGGYSYKGSELQPNDHCAMATIKNFARGGGFKLEGFKEIIPSTKLKPYHEVLLFDSLVAHTDLTQNADVIGNGEILLSTSGYDKIIMSMDLVKVVPKSTDISKFLIAAILADPRFKAHCLGYVNGTTVLHLSKKALPDYEILIPNDLAVLEPLCLLLESIYRKISLTVDEIVMLEKSRDELLPKLMSGEINVSNIDIE